MIVQAELALGCVGPRPTPIPDGPPLLVVLGANREACQRLTLEHWQALRLAGWVVPEDDLPRARLNIAFATPREKLPEDLRRQLDELERVGALTTWSSP